MAKGGVRQPIGVRYLRPDRPSGTEESVNVQKLDEIVVRASEIFGSREEAERWLEQPALGLDQRRPIDLLQTSAGVKLVEDFLGRLEYGVYD